jgi:hypothetical protein
MSRPPWSRRYEVLEVFGPNADRVDDPDVRQLPGLAQVIDRRCANAELLGDLSHAQQPTAPTVERNQIGRRGRRGYVRRRARRERRPDFG